MITFFVEGIPAPQGSKKAFKRGKKIVLVEMSEKLQPWRDAVARAAAAHRLDARLDEPVAVSIDFYLPAPKKSKFGAYPAGTPDVDKLVRSTFDGITASGLWVDDARAVTVHARKRWATDKPGASIRITTIREAAYSILRA